MSREKLNIDRGRDLNVVCRSQANKFHMKCKISLFFEIYAAYFVTISFVMHFQFSGRVTLYSVVNKNKGF